MSAQKMVGIKDRFFSSKRSPTIFRVAKKPRSGIPIHFMDYKGYFGQKKFGWFLL
jgi:hypothetical protein